MKVGAIDLSLTAAGVARLTLGDAGEVLGTYTGTAGQDGTLTETLAQRWYRLDAQRTAVLELIGTTRPDLVVIEGPAHAAKFGKPHDRAGEWWLIVDALHALGIPVAEVSPTTLKVYATGNGGSVKNPVTKAMVLAAVRKHYGVHFDIPNHNVADAIVLVAMGARHLGYPIDTLPTVHTRACASVRWPTLRERS